MLIATWGLGTGDLGYVGVCLSLFVIGAGTGGVGYAGVCLCLFVIGAGYIIKKSKY